MVRCKITTYAMMSRRPPPPPPPLMLPPTLPPPASDSEEEEVPEVDYPEDEKENDRMEAEVQTEIIDMEWAILDPENEEQAAIHAVAFSMDGEQGGGTRRRVGWPTS
jgi:hypothetical protein